MSVRQLVPLESKSYKELKNIAKELGVRTSGKMAELIQRIKEKRMTSKFHDIEDKYLSQVDVNDAAAVRKIYKKLAAKCDKNLSVLNHLESENITVKKASIRVKKLILENLNKLKNPPVDAQQVQEHYKIVVDVRGYQKKFIDLLERWADMSRLSANKFPYNQNEVLVTIFEVDHVLHYFSEEIKRLSIQNALALTMYDRLNSKLTELKEMIVDENDEQGCVVS